jgi:hypothetical protein
MATLFISSLLSFIISSLLIFFTDILLTYYFLLFIYSSRRDISISTLILYLLLILEARPTLAPLE